VRVTPDTLDMTWGMYERHLAREDAPQVEAGCTRFTQRKGTLLGRTDFLQVCGEVLRPEAPAAQTTVAFLMSGFRRTPLANDLGAAPRARRR